MKIIKLLIAILLLSTSFKNLHAQKTCISGDCVNGAGTLLKSNGDTVHSFYNNGKVSNQVLVASKNHTNYQLTSVETVRWFLNKRGDSISFGHAAIINKSYQQDASKGFYNITKKGDRFFEKDNMSIHFTNGKPIKAFIQNVAQQKNILELTSNGKDYIVLNFEQNKAVNGFLFIHSTNRIIYFDVVDARVVFSNVNDNQLFKEKDNSISSFTLDGFDEYYFNNFEKQRSIDNLEQYILRLKNTLLKPVDECIKLVNHASAEFEKLKQKNIVAKAARQKTPITLTTEKWNELFTNELVETCKSEFGKEYNDYLFDKELTGLPTKDDEVLYNFSRDENNIISLNDYSSNNELVFLIPAFKMAFASLTKKNSYIVPSAVRKYYDSKTLKSFDFRLKLK